MAGFLRTLTPASARSRPRFRAIAAQLSSSSSPFPPFQHSLFFPSSPAWESKQSPFSPLRGWVPFSGPLFLSATPWKLSQSATPLYLRGNEAVFAKDLILGRSFPAQLGFPALTVEKSGVGDVVSWGRSERSSPCFGSTQQESFLNLPNLISISRMVSGPFIGWMVINEWYLSAFCALVVSGATDWLDGYVARKMNINSVFGSYLDPLADKVLIGCVAVSMVEKDLLHSGLVSLVLFRDIVLVGGTFYKRASNLSWEWKTWREFVKLDASLQKVEPLFISKLFGGRNDDSVFSGLRRSAFRVQEGSQTVKGGSIDVVKNTVSGL